MMRRMSKMAHSGSGPSFKTLIPYRHLVDDICISYALPNRNSAGVVAFDVVSQINTKAGITNDMFRCSHEQRYIPLNACRWLYKGFILQGAMGHLATLYCSVRLSHYVGASLGEAASLEGLKNHIYNSAFDYFEKPHGGSQSSHAGFNFNLRKERETSSDYIPDECLVQLPTDFEHVKIHDATWLKYRYGGQAIIGHEVSWACPLSESLYVEFSFSLSPEIGKKHLRLQRMREDAERIMSSVTISRVSQ